MRAMIALAWLVLALAPVAAQSATEKPKAQNQLEAARAAIDAFARKTDGNKQVSGDLDAARSYLKVGQTALEGGSSLFGLGDISPETAQEIKYATDMVELYLTLGQTRIDSAKTAEEHAAISAQVAKMKARVKVFDDRKAELVKLRAAMEQHDAIVRELEDAKAENARLGLKTGRLEKERKALDAELDHLKAELAKRDQAEKQQAPATEAPVTPAPEAAKQ
jgi:hypothetical protein